MRRDGDLFETARVTRRASEAALDAAEGELGPLPPSYRAFARRYGGGLVGGLIRVYAPAADDGDLVSASRRLTAHLRDLVAEAVADGLELGGPDCLEPYDEGSRGVAARHRDLVVFAYDIDGNHHAWLRTGAAFAFHTIDRACLSVRFGGTDLDAMIRATQTEGVKAILGTGYAPLPRTFEGFARAAA